MVWFCSMDSLFICFFLMDCCYIGTRVSLTKKWKRKKTTPVLYSQLKLIDNFNGFVLFGFLVSTKTMLLLQEVAFYSYV